MTQARKPYRLAVLTTHPIQYQVPWFRRLASVAGIDLTVFFCQIPDPRLQGDGFGVEFQWDVPLLDGYRYRVMRNVAHHPSLTRFSGCDTPEIHDVVAREHYDAWIVNGWVAKSCIQLLVACRMRGVPCLVRGESNVLRERPLVVRCLHRMLLAQYAACLAIGVSNRDFYLRNGVPAESIFWTPYCVDNARFAMAADAARGTRDLWRSRWEIPAEACVFLFSGKLIPKKRPQDFLRALLSCRDRLAKRGLCVHGVLAGAGEGMDDCRRFAREHGLPVSFTGFLNQSEMPAVYAASDCLVLPSDAGETWGLVVNEAMACGLPALVSDHVGCWQDLVREGETGHVFPLGDTAVLADLMARLAADRDGRERMGEAARKRVEAYSYEQVTVGILGALDWVLATRNRGRTL